MKTTIIRADVSHAAFIAHIGKKSFRDAFSYLFKSKEELVEYLEYTYNPVKIARSIRKESNIYFLAMIDTTPIGFCKIKLDSLNEQIESVSQMELQKIYVLPGYQGSGAGSALLNTVLKLANETCPDYLWLDTSSGNEGAIRLYEKNGFAKIDKTYFTIGTQMFEYYLMAQPIAIAEPCHC